MRQTIASERAHRLRDALVSMATRYGSSMHRLGLAFNSERGTHSEKSWEHWERAGRRQFTAIQRIAKALRDVEVER